MKQFIKYLPMALFILTGCSNEDELADIGLAGSGNVILASIEQAPNTRVTIDDAKNLLWHTGDAFTVFNAENASYTYSLTSGAGTTTAEFTGEEISGTVAGAAYPSAYGPKLTGNKLTMTLPTTIDYTEDGDVKVPMYAVTTEVNSVSFKHLGGLLKVELKNLPVGTKTFEVTADKVINGSFTVADVTAADAVLASTATTATRKTVKVNLSDATTAISDKVFYLPLPAQTYGSIQTTVVKEDGTRIELSAWTNKTVERAKLYSATRSFTTIDAESPTVKTVSNSLTSAVAEATTNDILVEVEKAVGDAEDSSNTITIPQKDNANINLLFDVAPATTDAKLTLEAETGSAEASSDAKNSLTVTMPNGTTIAELNIATPATTVELAAPEGGTVTYTAIKSTTAINTLVIGKGVNVTNLDVKGGNVDIVNTGVVTNITLAEGSTVKSSDKKGVLTNMTAGAIVDLDGLQVENLTMTAENNLVTLKGSNSSKVKSLTVNNSGGYTLTKEGTYPSVTDLVDGTDAYLSELNCSVSSYEMSKDLTINNTITKLTYKGGTLTLNSGISTLDNQSGNELTINIPSGSSAYVGKIADDSTGDVNVNYETKTSADLNKIASRSGTWTLADNVSRARVTYGIAASGVATLNLNGYTFTCTESTSSYSAFLLRGYAKLTINGESGGVTGANTRVVWTGNANNEVTINGGTYVGGVSEVIYCEQGTITITGGSFRSTYTQDKRYYLNCKDANYKAGTAKIIVKGGKFYNFNPADCLSEGTGTNFVAEGYKSEKRADETIDGVTYEVWEVVADN